MRPFFKKNSNSGIISYWKCEQDQMKNVAILILQYFPLPFFVVVSTGCPNISPSFLYVLPYQAFSARAFELEKFITLLAIQLKKIKHKAERRIAELCSCMAILMQWVIRGARLSLILIHRIADSSLICLEFNIMKKNNITL
mgnify:CR=1 FL=1